MSCIVADTYRENVSLETWSYNQDRQISCPISLNSYKNHTTKQSLMNKLFIRFITDADRRFTWLEMVIHRLDKDKRPSVHKTEKMKSTDLQGRRIFPAQQRTELSEAHKWKQKMSSEVPLNPANCDYAESRAPVCRGYSTLPQGRRKSESILMLTDRLALQLPSLSPSISRPLIAPGYRWLDALWWKFFMSRSSEEWKSQSETDRQTDRQVRR